MAKDKIQEKQKVQEITDWEDVPITDWEDVPVNGENKPSGGPSPENDPIPSISVNDKRQHVIGAINQPFNTINKKLQEKYPKLTAFLGKGGMNLTSDVADILASPVTMATSGAYKALNTAKTGSDFVNAGLETATGGVLAPAMAFNPLVRQAVVGAGTALKAAPEKVQKFVSAPVQTIAGQEGDGYETADRALQFAGAILGNKLPESISGKTRYIPQKIGGLNVETVAPINDVNPIAGVKNAIKESGKKNAMKNFFRANQPGAKDLGYKQHYDDAISFIKKTEKANPTKNAPKGEMARRGYENIKKSASDYYENYVEPQLDRVKDIGARVDTKSAAESMRSTVSKTDEIGNASKLAAIDDFVQKTPESMTVQEANDFAKALKKETKAYQSATDVERNAMISANPLLEAKIAFLHKLQDNIAGTLESFGEKNVKKTVKTYGSIAYLRDKAFENVVKSEIEYNEPFVPPLSKGGAVSDVVSKILGNTKEKQMKRAMTGIAKYADEPPAPFIPERPKIAGLLEDPSRAKSPTNYPVDESRPTTPIGGPATPWTPTILPYEPVASTSLAPATQNAGLTLGGIRKTADVLSEGSPIRVPTEEVPLMSPDEISTARSVLPKGKPKAVAQTDKPQLEWKQIDNDKWSVKVGDKEVSMSKDEITTPKETEAVAVQKAADNVDVVNPEVASTTASPEQAIPLEQQIINVAQQRSEITKRIAKGNASDEDLASFRSLTDQLRDLQIEKLRSEKTSSLEQLRAPGGPINPSESLKLIDQQNKK